jgi:hypothetical protein
MGALIYGRGARGLDQCERVLVSSKEIRGRLRMTVSDRETRLGCWKARWLKVLSHLW